MSEWVGDSLATARREGKRRTKTKDAMAMASHLIWQHHCIERLRNEGREERGKEGHTHNCRTAPPFSHGMTYDDIDGGATKTEPR